MTPAPKKSRLITILSNELSSQLFGNPSLLHPLQANHFPCPDFISQSSRNHLAIISQSSPSFPACSFLFLPFHLAYNLACNLASISSSHPLYLLSRLSFSSSEASLSNVSGFFLILSRESSLTSHSSSDEFPVLSKCVT